MVARALLAAWVLAGVCSVGNAAQPLSGSRPRARDVEGQRPAREELVVVDILSTSDGYNILILRTSREPWIYVPMELADVEAVAIGRAMLRIPSSGPSMPRLLAELLAAGHIELTEITIVADVDGTFASRIKLRQDKRTWELDARPQDAIGLAVQVDVPIRITRAALDSAGIDPRDIDDDDEHDHPSSPPTRSVPPSPSPFLPRDQRDREDASRGLDHTL